jgi:hypothetical protein
MPEPEDQLQTVVKDDTLSSDIISPTDSYILKDDKYFKLDTGIIYLQTKQTGYGVRVMIHSWRDYFLDDADGNPGVQNWRQNAVILQFWLENIEQFKSKTYKIVRSEVNTGYDYQFTPTEQADKFPNDSLCIGFYHIGAKLDNIEFMSFGYTYGFDGYFVLQSGELEVKNQSSYYEFLGNFTDSEGMQVKMKFKIVLPPVQYNN